MARTIGLGRDNGKKTADTKEIKALKKENEALKKETETLKAEIEGLKKPE